MLSGGSQKFIPACEWTSKLADFFNEIRHLLTFMSFLQTFRSRNDLMRPLSAFPPHSLNRKF